MFLAQERIQEEKGNHSGKPYYMVRDTINMQSNNVNTMYTSYFLLPFYWPQSCHSAKVALTATAACSLLPLLLLSPLFSLIYLYCSKSFPWYLESYCPSLSPLPLLLQRTHQSSQDMKLTGGRWCLLADAHPTTSSILKQSQMILEGKGCEKLAAVEHMMQFG